MVIALHCQKVDGWEVLLRSEIHHLKYIARRFSRVLWQYFFLLRTNISVCTDLLYLPSLWKYVEMISVHSNFAPPFVLGEAAGLAMGLVMIGTASPQAIEDMVTVSITFQLV